MTDNLARFERMAQRARERGAGLRAQKAVDLAERERQQAAEEAESRQSPRFLAGPPYGCGECWEWRPHPTLGGYSWWHGAPLVREVKLWPVGEPDCLPEPTEHCMHACHGPDGEPLPVVVYA